MPTDSMANPLSFMFPWVAVILIFYFIVLRPEKDKQKKHKEMVNNLKKNDQVVTSSGIHGTVVNVKDKTIQIRVDDNVKIEFDKEAIVTIEKSSNN
jgi:preprotein translocase subunit YajC